MTMWEYRKIDLGASVGMGDDIVLLNTAGQDGWEVVAITLLNVAYLKRRVQNENPLKDWLRKVATSPRAEA
jgi:hypothetical protein